MTSVPRFPFTRPDLQLTRPIVLVGLMGAGKTTTGRRLAKRLNIPFVDSDEAVEEAAGMKVSDLFEIYGEADFRDGERRVVARLLDEEPKVLATGGGAFMNAETRALVKQKSTSVWLKADLATHVRRTSLKDTRPILRKGNPEDILRKLMAEREPVYAEADITVESRDGPHRDTVGSVMKALHKFRKEGKKL